MVNGDHARSLWVSLWGRMDTALVDQLVNLDDLRVFIDAISDSTGAPASEVVAVTSRCRSANCADNLLTQARYGESAVSSRQLASSVKSCVSVLSGRVRTITACLPTTGPAPSGGRSWSLPDLRGGAVTVPPSLVLTVTGHPTSGARSRLVFHSLARDSRCPAPGGGLPPSSVPATCDTIGMVYGCRRPSTGGPRCHAVAAAWPENPDRESGSVVSGADEVVASTVDLCAGGGRGADEQRVGARAAPGGAVAQGQLLGRTAKPAVGSRSGYSSR